MNKLGIGAAILISVILGIILLSILGISGMFSLIILGFAATYLTDPSERNYKAGGFAGIILSFLIFIYGLFVSPQLPLTPPSLSGVIMISLQIYGIFDLILGLIVSILIFYIFGCIGGLIAQKLLEKKKVKQKTHKRVSKGKENASQRYLNRR